MKRLLAFIGNIIFVAVVLYLCYFIVLAAQNRSPDVFGYRMLRVMSDSMEPVFGSGECIIVKAAEQDEIQVGDIVTFISADPLLNGSFNTHRIMDIVPDRTTGRMVYFTKGDNNSWTDDYTIYYEDIVGKYIYKLPYGRKFSAFLDKLSDRSYYFAIIIIPILLCFISCILQVVREVRRRQE